MLIKAIQYQSRVSCEDFYYSRPNGLNEYVLVLAHSPAVFIADGQKYLLTKNQLFIYNKNQPQLFYCEEKDFLHDWFHFDFSEEEAREFRYLDIPFGKPISPDNPVVLSDLIKLMAFEYQQNGQHHLMIMDKYVKLFFLHLYELLHKGQNVNKSHPMYQQFSEIRNEILSFPYRNWSAGIAAKSIHISKSWFQRNYKKLFGVSFQQDLINSRIECAKKMLLSSDVTVDYVAKVNGYNNNVHFMRQFKSMTGFTPSEYRKKYS